jgi:DNA primase
MSQRGTLADVFRDRAMIPVRGPHGQIVAFAGRAPDTADGTPKYLNTKQTPIYAKDHVLDGLAESGAALAAGARPVLVEGYFDRIAVTEAGRLAGLAGVSPGGTALSRHQMQALAAVCDLQETPLLVAMDPDAAGRKATVRDYELISGHSPAAATPALPDGLDPADIFQLRGPASLAQALTTGEHPLADAAVDAVLADWAGELRWPHGQVFAVRAVARVLAQAPPADPVRQIARVAAATGVPHHEVAGEFAAAIAAVEADPKAGGPAGASADRPRGSVPASRDFPAAPAPGRRPRPRRAAASPRPHLGGRRPPGRR